MESQSDECCKCGIEVLDQHPHWELADDVYCWDCSLVFKFIDAQEYLKFLGGYYYDIDKVKIVIRRGRPYIYRKTNPKNRRRTKKYANWRTLVFERDNYTCQKCNIRGGNLNAHHILGFKKHPLHRYRPGNGITLCVECHRNEHRGQTHA